MRYGKSLVVGFRAFPADSTVQARAAFLYSPFFTLMLASESQPAREQDHHA